MNLRLLSVNSTQEIAHSFYSNIAKADPSSCYGSLYKNNMNFKFTYGLLSDIQLVFVLLLGGGKSNGLINVVEDSVVLTHKDVT